MTERADSSATPSTPPLRLALAVDDPVAVAASCWEAGLTVVVEDVDGAGERLVVVVGLAGVRVTLLAEDLRSE